MINKYLSFALSALILSSCSTHANGKKLADACLQGQIACTEFTARGIGASKRISFENVADPTFESAKMIARSDKNSLIDVMRFIGKRNDQNVLVTVVINGSAREVYFAKCPAGEASCRDLMEWGPI